MTSEPASDDSALDWLAGLKSRLDKAKGKDSEGEDSFGSWANLQELATMLSKGGISSIADDPTIPSQLSNLKGNRAGSLLIDKFEIHEPIGRGGFGFVFRARDTILGRDVALKMPLPDVLMKPELRERFLAEARAAASLDHPHLVPIHEAKELGSLCYIAYGFCKGPSLSRWLSERKEPVCCTTATEVIAKIADAVALAHSRGICHRDIKPSNILLDEPSNTVGELPADADLDRFVPKLTDFGLARWMDSPHLASRSGQLIGTARYMSPEQAEGKSSDVGPPSDVYSLGITLYELLTGSPPFAGPSDLQTLIMKIRDDVPSLRDRRSDIPKVLEAICLKCLEKDPGRRYPTARELSEDLKRYLAGQRVEARPKNLWTKTVAYFLRQPAALSVAFLFVLALSILGGVYARQRALESASDEVQRAKSLARENELKLTRMRYANELRLAEADWNTGDARSSENRLMKLMPREGDPDVRGFLWRYLRQRTTSLPDHYKGLKGPAYCLATEPSNRWLAGGAGDGTVGVWDLQTKKLLWSQPAHQSDVTSVEFSPDGSRLYSVSDDRFIRVWKTADGAALDAIGPLDTPLAVLALVPERNWCVVAGQSSVIQLVDLDSKQVTARLVGHKAEINDLEISGKGDLLVSASSDATIRVWELPAGQLVRTMRGHRDSVTAVALMKEDTELASVGVDGLLRIWSLDRGEVVRSRIAHDQRIDDVAYSPERGQLVTCGKDKTVKVWTSQELSPVHGLACTWRNWSVGFTAKGDRLVAPCDDGNIHFWTDEMLSSRQTWQAVGNETIACSPDSSLISFVESHSAVVVKRGSRHVTSDRRWEIPDVASLVFSRDSSLLLTQRRDESLVRFWNLSDQRCIREMPVANSNNGSLFRGEGPEELVMATAGLSGKILVYDLKTGSLSREFRPSFPFASMTLSADGRYAALPSVEPSSPAVEVIDVSTTGGGRQTLPLDSTTAVPCAFSQDGRWLAVVCPPKTIHLYSVPSFERISTIQWHSEVRSVAFSPHEELLAVGTTDGHVCFCSVPEGDEIARFSVESPVVLVLTFAPDGRWMAVRHLAQVAPSESPPCHVTLFYAE